MENQKETHHSQEVHKKSSVKALKRISKIMDEAIRIPGTNIRLGLDPLIGLFPGVGDTLSFLISTYPIMKVAQEGGNNKLLLKMGLNILIDYLIGLFPFFGDIADVAFKANRRNLDLLMKYYEEHPQEPVKSSKSLWLVSFILALVLAIMILLGYKVMFLLKD